MSGYAQFLNTMEDIARKVMAAKHGHVDERLDRLEERVTALENAADPATAKARPAAKAKAQTATARGTAGKESAG